jgi:hypothetical protein
MIASAPVPMIAFGVLEEFGLPAAGETGALMAPIARAEMTAADNFDCLLPLTFIRFPLAEFLVRIR